MPTPLSIDRRRTLLGAGLLIGLGLAGARPLLAETVENDTADRLAAFTGGRTPQEGRITIDLPDVAENGAAVPLSLQIDSPMTAEDHVRRVLILATGNPSARVAELQFSPLSGEAAFATRIRLGRSQDVTVLAEMSDGRLYTASRRVQVTLGGCIG